MTREIEVDGRRVRLSSLDRVLWPRTGTTKRDLVDYYSAVAGALLPHVADRPLTLHRFPEGVGGDSFYQTRCPPHPAWLRTQRMHVFATAKDVDAAVIDDRAGLLWAANLSAIELHPYLARTTSLDRPDVVVFDLDPAAPVGLVAACRVALRLRAVLDALALPSYPKTSGARGIHVYVPVAGHAYTETKAFARRVARRLATHDPQGVSDRMAKAGRTGKVLVDWSQNDAGKSTVAPYSVRGLDVPTVSAPVRWSEVEEVASAGEPRRLFFGPRAVVDRIERFGDLFAEVTSSPVSLPDASP